MIRRIALPSAAIPSAAISGTVILLLAAGTAAAPDGGADRGGSDDGGRTPVRTVESLSGPIRVETVADGLVHPWGMALLPDGAMLVTEKPGRLRRIDADGALSEPLAGVPDVFAEGQGGLLDVALDPAFAENRRIYLAYAEPGPQGATTAVARARLADGALEEVAVIFRQEPAIQDDKHFGARLAFSPDGLLFIGLGERFQFDPAQDLGNHLGTVVRIRPDGTVPDDNPFVGRPDARPEVWSYGHRNIQAAAIHPTTGALWVVEHGPRGGDEMQVAEAGANYGWPVVSWGDHYDGRDIPDPPTRPEFADAALQWTPVIAPSGLVFQTGDLFPDWRGDALVGGLKAMAIVRVDMDGPPREVERLDMGARIRDLEPSPDGALFALTDEPAGRLLRLVPADVTVARP